MTTQPRNWASSYNDVVRVISPAGEVEAIVYVYPGIGEDVVAMPIGRGHTHYGRFAAGKGSNPIAGIGPGGRRRYGWPGLGGDPGAHRAHG